MNPLRISDKPSAAPSMRVKFHNGTVSVYRARMISAAPRTLLLARLRTSARLAVFVLLVFALKIGAAAACAKHDFADLGMGTDSSHTVMQAPTDSGDADLAKTLPGHTGAACSHYGCHHAAAVVPSAYISSAIATNGLTVSTADPPSSASPLRELRPPIA